MSTDESHETNKSDWEQNIVSETVAAGEKVVDEATAVAITIVWRDRLANSSGY